MAAISADDRAPDRRSWHADQRERQPGGKAVEEPHQQHAVHGRAHGARDDIDMAFRLLADALAKPAPEITRQRFALLVQEEQQQDREDEDQQVPSRELAERLRQDQKRRRVGPLGPAEQRSGRRKVALPASEQRQVLQPRRQDEASLVGGGDLPKQRVALAEERPECECDRREHEHGHDRREHQGGDVSAHALPDARREPGVQRPARDGSDACREQAMHEAVQEPDRQGDDRRAVQASGGELEVHRAIARARRRQVLRRRPSYERRALKSSASGRHSVRIAQDLVHSARPGVRGDATRGRAGPSSNHDRTATFRSRLRRDPWLTCSGIERKEQR